MIQAAGPKFTNLLHDVFSTLCVHEIQPAAWQMSLMQPIYKGGDKSKAGPASYRGIYLSSALAKLLEEILISRLTNITETHSTLTENQLGTRSGRQIHDAIYCLLFIIQYNKSPTNHLRSFLQHTLLFVTSPPRSQAFFEGNSEECGNISENDFT